MLTIKEQVIHYPDGAAAGNAASQLQSGEFDGWNYTPVWDTSVSAYAIRVTDQNGDYVGFWSNS